MFETTKFENRSSYRPRAQKIVEKNSTDSTLGYKTTGECLIDWREYAATADLPKENTMTLDQSGPKRLTIYLNEEVWGKLQRLNNYLGMKSSSVVQAMIHREFANKRRYIEVVEKYAPEEGEE